MCNNFFDIGNSSKLIFCKKYPSENNSCKDLSKSLSEIEVYSQNTETKKKPGVTKSLLSKRDKTPEEKKRNLSRRSVNINTYHN